LSSPPGPAAGWFRGNGRRPALPGWGTTTGGDAASLVATDAQLFASATDLRLTATSPAIDTGLALGAPSTDVLGIARPQGTGIDIGAYEYCSGSCTGAVEPGGDTTGGEDSGSGDGSGSGTGDGTGSDGDDDTGASTEDPSSGGCSAVHPPGLALALLAFVRRRRRRSARTSS